MNMRVGTPGCCHATPYVSSSGSSRCKRKLLLVLLSCVAAALARVHVARVFAHVPPATSCSAMV